MTSARHNRIFNAAFLAVAFAFLTFVLYPGRFDGDSIGQYQQGLAFSFDDAHSVMNAAVLGILSHLAAGSGPMFVLQLFIWIGGLFLLTDTLIASGRPFAGMAISLLALMPLLSFDYLDIQKDALFTALLAVLIGSGARLLLRQLPMSVTGALASFGVLVLALDTRQNAFFALIPTWFIFWPVKRLKARPMLSSICVGAVVFMLALGTSRWIDDKILTTSHSHIIVSLMIFDLAGISARTGQDASQGLLPDFSENVAKCYNRHNWDEFLGGDCRPVFLAATQMMRDPPTNATLMRQWITQILRHPLAYAEHRFRNFQCLIRAGCTNPVGGGYMSPGLEHRPWDEPNIRVTTTAHILEAMELHLGQGILGHGVFWLSVLTAELGVAGAELRRRGFSPTAYLTAVLAAAGIAYTMAYAVIGVADELRYLHPMIFLGVVAAPLAISIVSARSPNAKTGNGLRSSERDTIDMVKVDLSEQNRITNHEAI